MKPPKAIDYGPINQLRGYRTVRWVENVSCGLRLVGFADEIARKEGSRSIDHKGWFTSDDGDTGEVYRGIVYQLPARDGKPQYVYGYADPNNDDCALLCFDAEVAVMDAARGADALAERFAEDARDYDRAYCARRQFDDLADEIKATRREALALGAELRAARRANLDAPTLLTRGRVTLLALYRSIQKARKERVKLYCAFGNRDGFAE